jgi:2-keto-4-pentenoate hydratase
MGVDDAYAIQQCWLALHESRGEPRVGWKLGLTSEAMQSMLGVDTPDYSALPSSLVLADGATVSMGAYIAPRIEGEVAVWLARPLAGPGVTVEDVYAAAAGASAVMEVVDSRIRDWRITLCDTVADLASCGSVVMSPAVAALDGIDLRTVELTLTRNGEVVTGAQGSAALGDPAYAVAWLANTLARFGERLEAGQFVMTGALHAAIPLSAGDAFRAEISGIGSVGVQVAAAG